MTFFFLTVYVVFIPTVFSSLPKNQMCACILCFYAFFVSVVHIANLVMDHIIFDVEKRIRKEKLLLEFEHVKFMACPMAMP